MICAKHMDIKQKLTVHIRKGLIILVMIIEDINRPIQEISVYKSTIRYFRSSQIELHQTVYYS